MSETTHWLEILNERNKIRVIFWSAFAKKRYYVFEQQIEAGKYAWSAFKDTQKMSYKKVRQEYIRIRISKLQK